MIMSNGTSSGENLRNNMEFDYSLSVIIAMIDILAIVVGVFGDVCVIIILIKVPVLRDNECFIHISHILYGLVALVVCGIEQTIHILNLTKVEVLECVGFTVINAVLQLAYSVTLVYAMIERCISILKIGYVTKPCIVKLVCGLTTVVSIPMSYYWIRVRYRHLSDCSDMPSDVFVRFSIVGIMLDVILIIVLVIVYILNYRKLYVSFKRVFACRNTFWFFLKRERKGFMTVVFLTTVFIAFKMPQLIMRIQLLTGADITFYTYHLCSALQRISFAIHPFIFILFTKRFRTSFKRCLQGKLSKVNILG